MAKKYEPGIYKQEIVSRSRGTESKIRITQLFTAAGKASQGGPYADLCLLKTGPEEDLTVFMHEHISIYVHVPGK